MESTITKEISLSKEQEEKMDQLISEHNQEVSFYYEKGVCEIIFVPIENGELRVFHHKPKNPVSKRPVLFLPGFGTSPWSWRHFSTPMHEKAEYYILESREKSSSITHKRRKAKMSIDQIAKDLAEAIQYLGLAEKDFVLFGSSFSGGVIMAGLLEGYFDAPTIAVHDPIKDWRMQKKLTYIFAPIPPFVVKVFKPLLAKITLARMKNQSAKERYLDFVRNATVWKWRKTGIHNLKFNINDELSTIDQEILLFHGPKDKYHEDEEFVQYATNLPKGRYIYMKSAPEFRELVVGISSLELSKITRDENIPKSLAVFEVDLERKKNSSNLHKRKNIMR